MTTSSPATVSVEADARKLGGVLPVVQTPYHADGRVDLDALAREVDWLIGHGVDGLTLGMVSELSRLTDAERDSVVWSTVRAAAGRVPIVAGVGAESLAQAVRHARAAEAAGVQVLMATPPMRALVVGEAIAYYRALLAASSLPVIIQDASAFQGVALALDELSILHAEAPHRVWFKPEASPVPKHITAVRSRIGSAARIFVGRGGADILEVFALEVDGVMPGSEAPWAHVKLWRSLADGDMARARRIHEGIVAMIDAIEGIDGFLAMEKLCLVEQGLFANDSVRGPVGFRLDPTVRAHLLRLLDDLRERVEG
jgi:dihydrodipicolinate synthase/N-acetylneuraminate lyase